MPSQLDIAPEGTGGAGSGGGGPEGDPTYSRVALRSQGLLALAFGFALGITFMIFFGIFHRFGAPIDALKDFVAHVNPNLWLSFLYGFIGGTVVAAIYNMLVVRRLNLFGLESSTD